MAASYYTRSTKIKGLREVEVGPESWFRFYDLSLPIGWRDNLQETPPLTKSSQSWYGAGIIWMLYRYMHNKLYIYIYTLCNVYICVYVYMCISILTYSHFMLYIDTIYIWYIFRICEFRMIFTCNWILQRGFTSLKLWLRLWVPWPCHAAPLGETSTTWGPPTSEHRTQDMKNLWLDPCRCSYFKAFSWINMNITV